MDDHALLEHLSHRLWDERHVVTQLLYRLTLTKLQLSANATEDVASTLHEVNEVIATLREQEDRRADALAVLAHAWGTSADDLSLTELARRSPPPFDTTFRDHASTFGDLAGEIEQIATENRAMARNRLDDVVSALELLSGADHVATPTYDASGRVGASAPGLGGRVREVL